MAPIVATYLVKITLREPEPLPGADGAVPPTIDELIEMVGAELEDAGWEVHVAAERTDI